MLWDNGYIVKIVSEFLIQGIGEGEFDMGAINRFHIRQILPYDGVRYIRICLSQFIGEHDIIGGQWLAIAPNGAGLEGHIKRGRIGPGSGFREHGGRCTR